MTIIQRETFLKTARKKLEVYVANGGDVSKLGNKDDAYSYIKKYKIFDEQGNALNLEQKFNLLGFPRKAKVSTDLKQDLINEIEEYLAKGGSFHIARKKLPFYEKLASYSNKLNKEGIFLTHEEVMKNVLGYKNYSDTYFRCKRIENLSQFRDEFGYVDLYREDLKMNRYVKDLSQSLEIPYYLVITLLADEKLKKCKISVNYINYVKQELQNYIEENSTLKGIRRKNPKLYYKLDTIKKYFSDGSEEMFSLADWVEMLLPGQVEHRFKDEFSDKNIDLTDLMTNLKQTYGNKIIRIKDLDRTDYFNIIRKSVRMGITIPEFFALYGLKCNGNKVDRLSSAYVTEIPYLQEMKTRRDFLILQSGITEENGFSKEEIMEAKTEIVKQVYKEFKEKIESFVPANIEDEEETTLKI